MKFGLGRNKNNHIFSSISYLRKHKLCHKPKNCKTDNILLSESIYVDA